MTTVLTIIAMVAGTALFTLLLMFLMVGLMTWLEDYDLDPLAAVIGWMCDFWEKRL